MKRKRTPSVLVQRETQKREIYVSPTTVAPAVLFDALPSDVIIIIAEKAVDVNWYNSPVVGLFRIRLSIALTSQYQYRILSNEDRVAILLRLSGAHLEKNWGYWHCDFSRLLLSHPLHFNAVFAQAPQEILDSFIKIAVEGDNDLPRTFFHNLNVNMKKLKESIPLLSPRRAFKLACYLASMHRYAYDNHAFLTLPGPKAPYCELCIVQESSVPLPPSPLYMVPCLDLKTAKESYFDLRCLVPLEMSLTCERKLLLHLHNCALPSLSSQDQIISVNTETGQVTTEVTGPSTSESPPPYEEDKKLRHVACNIRDSSEFRAYLIKCDEKLRPPPRDKKRVPASKKI